VLGGGGGSGQRAAATHVVKCNLGAGCVAQSQRRVAAERVSSAGTEMVAQNGERGIALEAEQLMPAQRTPLCCHMKCT
jgi:hypothetical protein